ncbi:hypothetical protein ABKN59_005496 [Abortiporus biennis]
MYVRRIGSSVHDLIATMAEVHLVVPKLDNTLGAMFIGLIVSSILYGITCVQTYVYYVDNKTKDRVVLRSMVAVLWILNTLDMVFITHCVYYFAVTNYANPTSFNTAPWSVGGFNVIANLNDVIIRGILIDRIYKISLNNKFVLVALWVGNLTVSAFGLSLSIQIDKNPDLQALGHLAWLIYCCFTTMAAVDTIIAIVLCAILWSRKTGFSHTDSQIQTLMRYSIHTGALTSFVAIVIVITYAAMPHNFIFIGIYLSLPKFYLNALLATLNARDSLKGDRQQVTGAYSFHVSRMAASNNHPEPHVNTGCSGITSESRPDVIVIGEPLKGLQSLDIKA